MSDDTKEPSALAQFRLVNTDRTTMLDKLYAAVPALAAAGVRRLEATEHGFVLELEQREPAPQPEPPDEPAGDDLDLAHTRT